MASCRPKVVRILKRLLLSFAGKNLYNNEHVAIKLVSHWLLSQLVPHEWKAVLFPFELSFNLTVAPTCCNCVMLYVGSKVTLAARLVHLANNNLVLANTCVKCLHVDTLTYRALSLFSRLLPSLSVAQCSSIMQQKSLGM